MAIYRGQGGAGDATGDATNQALVAQEAAQSASNSATAASTSAESASTSAANAAASAVSAAASAAAALVSENNADVSEANALASANSASTSATNSATSATNSLNSANDSAASAALAQDWATKTTGPVAGGEYSAKYHANSAIASSSSAAASASAASTSASNAATSASNAASSASTATTKAAEALASANAADISEANAATSANNAATSESNAASSASSASTSAASAAGSASSASTSASNAASSASSASSSASSASSSATNASNSASAAATSASNAAASETAAAGSATSAAGSASSASTSATNAANSATSASNSATSASTSASNAATSETNAANSASSASTSATNAAASASSASSSASSASSSASAAATSASNAATSESNTAAIYDLFDDRMLGNKASDPSVDNDGNALVEGTLYWNTTTKVLRIYTGTGWQNTANASSGTVTSVDMTVPTGLQVTGNPITSAGTLAVSYAAGYSIPTNTKQGQWDTAYSWGDHATYGYATITGTETLTNKTLTNPVINGFTGNTSVINIGSGQFYKDAAGNIAIGHTSPSYKLDIQNAGAFTGMSIGNTTTSGLTNLFIYNTVNTLTYGVSPGGSYMSYTGTGPLSFSAGGSDLFTFSQTGELGIGLTPDGTAHLQIAAGTASKAPLELISSAGTLMTTPDDGSIEYDGGVFFGTPIANSRGVMITEHFVARTGTKTMTSNTSLQSIFGGGTGGLTNGALTVAASCTYYFECFLSLSGMSSTSGNFGFSILGAGTATFTSAAWQSIGYDGVSGAASTMSGSINLTGAQTGNIFVAATSSVAGGLIKGIFRINTGGTIIPSIQLTTAAAAIIGANCWFKCYPVGTNNTISVGNWS